MPPAVSAHDGSRRSLEEAIAHVAERRLRPNRPQPPATGRKPAATGRKPAANGPGTSAEVHATVIYRELLSRVAEDSGSYQSKIVSRTSGSLKSRIFRKFKITNLPEV